MHIFHQLCAIFVFEGGMGKYFALGWWSITLTSVQEWKRRRDKLSVLIPLQVWGFMSPKIHGARCRPKMSKFIAPNNGLPIMSCGFVCRDSGTRYMGADVRTRLSLPGSDKLISRTVQFQHRDLHPRDLNLMLCKGNHHRSPSIIPLKEDSIHPVSPAAWRYGSYSTWILPAS